jgi:hypothetical protein
MVKSLTWPQMVGSITFNLYLTRHGLSERGCIVDYNVSSITAVSLARTDHDRQKKDNTQDVFAYFSTQTIYTQEAQQPEAPSFLRFLRCIES